MEISLALLLFTLSIFDISIELSLQSNEENKHIKPFLPMRFGIKDWSSGCPSCQEAQLEAARNTMQNFVQQLPADNQAFVKKSDVKFSPNRITKNLIDKIDKRKNNKRKRKYKKKSDVDSDSEESTASSALRIQD